MDDRLISDDNGGGKTPNSFHHHHGGRHHHHHQFYISPHCPLHRPILQPKNHSPSCHFSTSYPNPEPVASARPDPNSGFPSTHPGEELDDASTMIKDETDTEIAEADEEEEPIFVLTDEWKEFFAKSEAKRILAKKQANKGKNEKRN